MKEKNFEKVSQCRKIQKVTPFGLFQTSVRRKISENLKGDHLEEKNRKKSRTLPKKFKGGPYSPVRLCILR